MSNRKSIHFTSDWHLGHANSLKFDERPFRDVDHMHRVLINNYNSQVPPDGVCYFLGDVGMLGTEAMAEIMAQLNGTKVLILGNHDKNYSSMYNAGFDVVLNAGVLYIAEERVTMTHCPLRGVFRERTEHIRSAYSSRDLAEGGPVDTNWHGEHKSGRYSVANEGQFHLHGHIHSAPCNDKPRTDGRQFDVGVPANDYRPVAISQIESWIARVKNGTWEDKS
jgi:calcineurin-like phosphoesterase family protein